jgi:magnesium transporter
VPNADDRDLASTERSVRVRVFVSGELEREDTTLSQESLRDLAEDRLVWIDLVNPERATLEVLADIYSLHPLTVDEVFDTHRESDVSTFDGSAHIVIYYPYRHDHTFTSGEIQVIIGQGFLISIHEPDILDPDDVFGPWRATPAKWRSTSSSLLYAILRTAMSAFSPIADHLSDALEELEDTAMDPENRGTPKRETLYKLFDLTEQITDLHNIAMPMKDMMQSLIHNSDWFSQENGNAYTRDIADDVVHLVNRTYMLRDTGQRLFEMVNSLVTLQRTDVSKQLTIVATIFLPLSFVASYFGQNFQFMTDAVASRDAYLFWGLGVQLFTLVSIFLALWKFGAFR